MTYKIKQGLFAGIAAAAIFTTPAMAQDAPEKEFEGFYVGGSVGYDSQSNDIGTGTQFDTNLDGRFGDTVRTTAGADAFSPGFCNGLALEATPTGCRNDRDDLHYAGRIGGDVQFGPLVIGAVGEIGKSDIRDSVSSFSTTPARYSFSRELDFNASLRARVGLAAKRTLFYATGGGAYGKINSTFATSNGANSFTGRGSSDAFGYTVGGGVETKLTKHISFGLEYLYNDLRDDDYTVRVGPGTGPATNPFLLVNAAGTDIRRSDANFRWHSMRATVNFRF